MMDLQTRGVTTVGRGDSTHSENFWQFSESCREPLFEQQAPP